MYNKCYLSLTLLTIFQKLKVYLETVAVYETTFVSFGFK